MPFGHYSHFVHLSLGVIIKEPLRTVLVKPPKELTASGNRTGKASNPGTRTNLPKTQIRIYWNKLERRSQQVLQDVLAPLRVWKFSDGC